MFKQAQTGPGAHPALAPMSNSVLSEGKKQPACDTEHSTPPSAGGKSERSYITIFPMCHHGMYGTNIHYQQNTGIIC